MHDYDPVIFMLEDTTFSSDNSVYYNMLRDIGRDGIFRDWGLDFEVTPYGATRRYFGELYGLDDWVYHQHDHPDHFSKLVEAQIRRDERRLATGGRFSRGVSGVRMGRGALELRGVPQARTAVLQEMGAVSSGAKGRSSPCTATLRAALRGYKEVIAETGIDVVEAFTPPPVSDLSLKEAREAWRNIIIWVNFPESMFWSGAEATKQYTIDLLKSAAPGDRLVLSFTEMGTWGATDDATEQSFKQAPWRLWMPSKSTANTLSWPERVAHTCGTTSAVRSCPSRRPRIREVWRPLVAAKNSIDRKERRIHRGVKGLRGLQSAGCRI